MNEQPQDRSGSLSMAQWFIFAIVMVSVFVLVDEIASGHIAITASIFWGDLFVCVVSTLIGLCFLYFFRRDKVDWRYRSAISNALWWTLVAFPHGSIVILNIFTFPVGVVMALLCWFQVIKLIWRQRKASKG